MSDLVERLRNADIHSQQRVLGSRIFGEAADEIARLQRELDEARELIGARAIERAETRESLFPVMSARIKAEREHARRQAFEEAAAYHDDLAAQHAAAHQNIVSDHHERMERQHTRFAAAIRALSTPPRKPSEAEGREAE